MPFIADKAINMDVFSLPANITHRPQSSFFFVLVRSWSAQFTEQKKYVHSLYGPNNLVWKLSCNMFTRCLFLIQHEEGGLRNS